MGSTGRSGLRVGAAKDGVGEEARREQLKGLPVAAPGGVSVGLGRSSRHTSHRSSSLQLWISAAKPPAAPRPPQTPPPRPLAGVECKLTARRKYVISQGQESYFLFSDTEANLANPES